MRVRGLDIEASWQNFLLTLIPDPERARRVHEAGMGLRHSQPKSQLEDESYIAPALLAVVRAAAYGLSSDEIARFRGTTLETVKTQRGRAISAFGARGMEEAVAMAFRSGLLGELPFL